MDGNGLLKALRLKLGINSNQANPERIRKISAPSRTLIIFNKVTSFQFERTNINPPGFALNHRIASLDLYKEENKESP